MSRSLGSEEQALANCVAQGIWLNSPASISPTMMPVRTVLPSRCVCMIGCTLRAHGRDPAATLLFSQVHPEGQRPWGPVRLSLPDSCLASREQLSMESGSVPVTLDLRKRISAERSGALKSGSRGRSAGFLRACGLLACGAATPCGALKAVTPSGPTPTACGLVRLTKLCLSR